MRKIATGTMISFAALLIAIAGLLLNVMQKNTDSNDKLAEELSSFSSSISVIKNRLENNEGDVADNKNSNIDCVSRFENHLEKFYILDKEFAMLKTLVVKP